MSPKHKKIFETIQPWLEEHKKLKIEKVGEEQNGFQILFTSPIEALAIYVAGVEKDDDIILVGWVWKLHATDKNYFQKVKKEKLAAFQKDLTDANIHLHVDVNFKPSIESPEYIESQKILAVNNLTKEGLYLGINSVLMAVGIVGKSLINHLSLPSRFDISSGV